MSQNDKTPRLVPSADMLSNLLDDSDIRAIFVGSLSTVSERGFTFPGNRDASMHLVLEGQAWIGAPGALRLLGKGEVALLPSDVPSLVYGNPEAQPHDLPASVPRVLSARLCPSEPGAFRVLTVALDYPNPRARPLFGALPDTLFLKLPKVAFNLARRTADFTELPDQGAEFATLRLGEALFSQVIAVALGALTLPDSWLPALRDERLSPALRAVHAEPSGDWSLAKLSRLAGLSSAAFCRQFSALTGTSPARYLRQLRIRRAKSLLTATTMNVAEAAAAVGYDSESSFSRAYLAVTGKRPGDERKRGESLR